MTVSASVDKVERICIFTDLAEVAYNLASLATFQPSSGVLDIGYRLFSIILQHLRRTRAPGRWLVG